MGSATCRFTPLQSSWNSLNKGHCAQKRSFFTAPRVGVEDSYPAARYIVNNSAVPRKECDSTAQYRARDDAVRRAPSGKRCLLGELVAGCLAFPSNLSHQEGDHNGHVSRADRCPASTKPPALPPYRRGCWRGRRGWTATRRVWHSSAQHACRASRHQRPDVL